MGAPADRRRRRDGAIQCVVPPPMAGATFADTSGAIADGVIGDQAEYRRKA
jgi:hypothetical protein